MNFGDAIKEQREKKGLSQSQLALMIEVKQQNISRWESMSNTPNILDCMKLADFFNVTLDELLGRTPTDTAPNSGIKITPLARRLLDTFDKLEEEDQRKVVGIVEALAVMS